MADKRIPGMTVIGTKSCARCNGFIYLYKEEFQAPDYCMECWEIVEEEKEMARAARRGYSEAFGPGDAVFDGEW